MLRRLSVDDDSAPAVDGGAGSGDGAAVEELRHQLEQYRTKAEIETRLLAEQHAKTAAELARKTADYDELRHRLGAVEAERQRKLAAHERHAGEMAAAARASEAELREVRCARAARWHEKEPD